MKSLEGGFTDEEAKEDDDPMEVDSVGNGSNADETESSPAAAATSAAAAPENEGAEEESETIWLDESELSRK